MPPPPHVAALAEVPVHTARGVLAYGTAFECPMLDISNHGMTFGVPVWMDVRGFLPGKAVSKLTVMHGPHCALEATEATVRHIQPATQLPGTGYRVTVAFLDRHGRGAPVSTVHGPVRIAALLQDALAHRTLWASPPDAAPRVPVHAAKSVDLTTQLFTVHVPPELGVQRGTALQIGFEADGAHCWFFTGVVDTPDADTAVVGVPRMLYRRRHRVGGRYPMHANAHLRVDVTTPFGKPLADRPVLDVSLQGLAFSIAYKHDLLPVGTRLDHVALHLADGTTLHLRGVVRTLVPDAAPEGAAKCGIQFETLGVDKQIALITSLINHGMPAPGNQLLDMTGMGFDPLWDVLRAVGVLSPEKEAQLRATMEPVRTTLTRLLEKPNNLARAMVFRHGSDVLAHLSALRSYSRTWMVHHLGTGKSQNSDATTLRNVLLGMTQYFDFLPESEWMHICYRPNNTWPQRAFGAFAARVESPASKLRVYSYMTAPSAGFKPGAGPGVLLMPASPTHLAQAETHALAHLGPLEFQACDLSQHLMALDGLNRQYQTLGLRRQREVWVAEDAQGMAGYALVEISSMGLNLSELLSVMRITMLRDNPVAYAALMHKGRERYLAHGRAVTVALVAQPEEAAFAAQGYTKEKEYAVWLWHRSLLPKYFEHVDRLTHTPPPKILS